MVSFRCVRTRRSVLLVALLVVLVMLTCPSFAAASDPTITVTGTGDSTQGASACTYVSGLPTSCPTLRSALDAASADGTGSQSDPDIELGSDQTYSITDGPLSPPAYTEGVANVEIDGNGSTIDLSQNGDNSFYELAGSVLVQDLTIANADAPGKTAVVAGSNPFDDFANVTFSHDDEASEISGSDVSTGHTAVFTHDTDTTAAIYVTGGQYNEITASTFIDETGRSMFLAGATELSFDDITGGTVNGTAVFAAVPVDVGELSISGVTATGGDAIEVPGGSSVVNLSITDNTLGAPAAAVDGGGSVTGQNWTIAGNTRAGTGSLLGAGVFADDTTLDLTFATLDGDSDMGQADELYATADGTINLGDSIVTGTSATGATQCAADPGSKIVSTGYNIDQAGNCGFDATGDQNGVNPRLEPLATSEIPLGSSGYSNPMTYAPLGYGSPAVAAIPASACSATTDELNENRPQDPNGCDIGAYDSPVTQFSLTQSGAPSAATAGSSVTYSLAAINASSTTVPQQTVITDTLPAGATLTSATVTTAAGTTMNCTGTTIVSCPVGPLAIGKQAVATITATLNSAGADTNSASVSSEYPDVNDAKGTVSATTQVSAGPTQTTPTSTTPTSTSTSTTPAPTTSTPTSTSPTPTPTPTPTKPVISGLKLSPVRFASRATKASVIFSSTAGGPLVATVAKTEPGVRSGKACVAQPTRKTSKKLTKCTRTITVTSFSLTAETGVNTVALPTKVRDLAPGTYKLTVGSKSISFTVTKPRPVLKKKHRLG